MVRDVLHRYCDAADRCDLDLMRSCYHDDAEDDHGFFSGPAPEFASFVIGCLKQIELSVHSISNIRLTHQLGLIHSECRYTALHRIRDRIGFTDFIHRGRYLDIFAMRDGAWKIYRRTICQDGEHWIKSADLSFLTRNSPNLPLQGSKDRCDPHYLGFDFPDAMVARPAVTDLWLGFRRLASLPLPFTRFVGFLGSRLFTRRS